MVQTKLVLFFAMGIVLLAGCSQPAAQPLNLVVDGVDPAFGRSQVASKLGAPKRLKQKGNNELLEFPFAGDKRYLTTCEFSADKLVAIRGKTLSVGPTLLQSDSTQGDIEKALGKPTWSRIQQEPGESEEIKVLKYSSPGNASLEVSLFGGKAASFYVRYSK